MSVAVTYSARTSSAKSGFIVRLAAAALVDSFGTGCYLAGSAIFFTRKVGLSPSLVGLGLTWAGLLGVVTTIPWSRLADLWGSRRVLVLLLSIRSVAFFLYAFAGSFWSFIAITTLLGIVDKASSPVQQALVGEVSGDGRRQRTLAVMRSTRNVGFALGSLTAAAAVATASSFGYDSIVWINAASFVLAALVIGTLRVRPRSLAIPATASRRRAWRIRDRRYSCLTALNSVLTIHMSLLSVGIPLWLLRHTHAPASALPILLLINAVLAVVFQMPVAARVQSQAAAIGALFLAAVALTLCCGLVALTGTVSRGGTIAVAVLAVTALTGAELLQAAGGWELSFRFAPEDRRGHYLGFFSLGTSAQTMAGPVLLTVGVFSLGAWGWAVLGVATLAVGIVVTQLLGRPSDTRDGTPHEHPG